MSSKIHIVPQKQPPAEMNLCGRLFWKVSYFFFFLGVAASGLRSLSFGHPLLEFIHPPGGIHELLRARVKRVANIADTNDDR